MSNRGQRQQVWFRYASCLRGRIRQARLSSLEGCTVSNRGQRPRTAGNSLSISLEGCTPAKMAARAAAPKAHSALMTTSSTASNERFLPFQRHRIFGEPEKGGVRLRRCGYRRHLRGRIALQANLSLPPTIPGRCPGLLTV